MNYDKLYGMTLDKYCFIHGTTIDKLIDKVEKDIFLLEDRITTLVWEENLLLDPLVGSCYSLLNKKRKHLKRLKKWKKENK